MIPMNEVPYQYNPERGFVSSANQKPVDDSIYPYYIGRDYPLYRGITANKKLAALQNVTVEDMMNLQTNNYDEFAAEATPMFMKNIRLADLDTIEKRYFNMLAGWDFNNEAETTAPTVFNTWWYHFDKVVYTDEFANAPALIQHPFESTLLEMVLKDSAYKFLDNIQTTQKETLADDVTAAFKQAVNDLKTAEAAGKLQWAKYKGTHVTHLAKIAPFSSPELSIGGGTHCLNAARDDHGPSWRMVISLTPDTEAFGVYPGGQSGNPGSKFYDNFINTWAKGKYYNLWVMKKGEEKDSKVIWTMNFRKG